MAQTWHRACAVIDVPEQGALHVDIAGLPICVVRSEGSVYAIYDVCSHADVPLSEGDVEDTTIECWLHGSAFDLQTGRPTSLPATQPVPVYPVKQDGDDILVAIEE
ncbi:MAG TPA: non-heme iron oxygenase ferredoxin subunit [Mycobacteriales bacterium]|nr:non-heme iron oxygenase ferredoxin subunit [Mycobacteriales bacterium]